MLTPLVWTPNWSPLCQNAVTKTGHKTSADTLPRPRGVNFTSLTEFISVYLVPASMSAFFITAQCG